MLRNRSRAVTKQALMADNNSPTKTPSSPLSSFLGSPRFFNGFFSKNLFDTEISMSPTSILDNKSPTSFTNPFRNSSKSPPEINKQETRAIGLALVDSIIQENSTHDDKLINRMVLLGSNLKVHIPNNNNNPTSPISPIESPESPADFGIKTRNFSQLSSPVIGTPSSKGFGRQLSLKEMELSEDYTCVITHGPNPKTTHIYDDCIVERSILDETESCEDKKIDCGFQTNAPTSNSSDFMSFCHNCREILAQGRDIYMYRSYNDINSSFVFRGEKAFCSDECRCQEMFFDGMKNRDSNDDAF